MANTGLYANLVPSGSAPPAQGVSIGNIAMPGVGATSNQLIAMRNKIWDSVLPDGNFKKAFMSTDGSIFSTFSALFKIAKGRKYREGHYKLGERLIDQVQCSYNIGYKDVPDEVVPLARLVFTQLFGVRIETGEDLDALDSGVDAYYARGNKDDIPRNAVERAVMLKQNYFPISTYNNSCWNLSYFDLYPLVAPIPEMNADMTGNGNINKLYSGPGLNDTIIVNGYVKPSAAVTNLTANIVEQPKIQASAVANNEAKDNTTQTPWYKNTPVIIIAGVSVLTVLTITLILTRRK